MGRKYKPVENHNNLYRDVGTNAIINNNMSEYQSYVANRNKLQSDKERIDGLEEKVNSLQGDISDIKNLLMKLVDK